MSAEVLLNGWSAVPMDPSLLFNGKAYRHVPEPLTLANMTFPSVDPVVAKMQAYAKQKLPWQTYNHSMRVYYFATAILKQQFPEFATSLSPSTLAMACLLHDIGTAEEYQASTRMSFEFHGGIAALEAMQAAGSTRDQAEAVCECVIRHQDLGTDGSITFLGQLIQLATVYDNVSEHPYVGGLEGIVHEETRGDVIGMFPRTGWLGCFAGTVEKEVRLKPWSHTTHIPGFADKIRGNKLMKQYE